jgi:hypothetical protein
VVMKISLALCFSSGNYLEDLANYFRNWHLGAICPQATGISR